MGGLGKLPIVSLLLIVAIAAVPFLLARGRTADGLAYEDARNEARAYLVRNPRLEVDPIGELMLDPAWLEETRAAASGDDQAGVQLPARMLARSQARLDAMIDAAYAARLGSDPAWRLGVLDAQTPRRNYFVHAFVHEAMAGIVLCVLVLLFVGAPLERAWGSLVYAVFAAAAIPMAAQGYRLLDAVSGVPWSGSAGLAGALLGAYFIRGLGGRFLIPGWVMLPLWLAAESLVVRGFWIDDLGVVPWATLCASIGVGALAAGALRLMNVESRVGALRDANAQSGPNPIVSRAARLRSDGDPYQAFDLIQAAWREDPKDEDVAEAFFSIAVEVDQPEAAAEAVLPLLRQALRKGEVERAIEYWLPLAGRQSEIRLEATAAVRLGEALLDAGRPEEAIASLSRALDEGVSAAHATRIVKIARDLDEGLTRRAASIALTDQTLDPRIREELEPIARLATEADGSSESEPTRVATPAPSRSQLDRRVAAEHHPVESTAFPLEADSDIVAPPSDREANIEANEASPIDQSLDAHALSAESLASEIEITDEEAAQASVDSGDVLSHWNDRTLLDEQALSGPDDGAAAGRGAELLGVADLESPYDEFDFGLDAKGDDFFDPADDETDTDLTPMMDATDETTSPVDEDDTHPTAAAQDDMATVVFDQPPPVVEKPAESPAAAPAEDFAIGLGDGANAPLRALKALEAIPLETTADSIEIDADDRGKSKLPISRIQAISMAAVTGLSPRPVLLVDFVLNWSSGSDEPLKLIRFRSDRFDPLQFVPGAENPLAALTAWVTSLQAASDATCLPSRELLAGRFVRFETLADYEREVLMAECRDAARG